MDDLGEETGHSADTHSDSLLSGLLECLLDYCMRYYERQFITRGPANEQLMRQYESVLDGYIRAGKLRTRGCPTAEYCSQRLGRSKRLRRFRSPSANRAVRSALSVRGTGKPSGSSVAGDQQDKRVHFAGTNAVMLRPITESVDNIPPTR